jgi:hypothetical protein
VDLQIKQEMSVKMEMFGDSQLVSLRDFNTTLEDQVNAI